MPALILTADDSEQIRSLLEMIIEADGHRVVQVADGREALTWLKDNTPDLMILDVTMPFMDGISVCARAKKVTRLKATPIIILTAHTDDESRSRAKLAGADAFVNKPLSGKDLRGTITEMLMKREALKAQLTRAK